MIYSDFAHPYLKDFKERIEEEGYYTLEFSQSANLNRFLKFMDWAKPDSKYALYPLKKNMNMGRGKTALGMGEYGRLVPLELQFDDWTYSGMRFGVNDDVTKYGDGKNRYAYLDFTKIPLNTKYDITVIYMVRHAVQEGIQNYYFDDPAYHIARDTYFCSDGSDQNYSIIAPYWSYNLYKAREGYTTLYDNELGTELKGVQLQTVKGYDGSFNQQDLWNQPSLKSNGDEIFCISLNSWGGNYLNNSEDTSIHKFNADGTVKNEYIPVGAYSGNLNSSSQLAGGTQTNNTVPNRAGAQYQLKTHSGSNSTISWPWQTPTSNVLEPFRLNFGLQQDLYQINTRNDGGKTEGLRHWAYAILVMSGYTDPLRVDSISEIMMESFGFNMEADMMYRGFASDTINATTSLSELSVYGEIATGDSINLEINVSDLENTVTILKPSQRNDTTLLSGNISDLIEDLGIILTGNYIDQILLSGGIGMLSYNAGVSPDSITEDILSGIFAGISGIDIADGIWSGSINVLEYLSYSAIGDATATGFGRFSESMSYAASGNVTATGFGRFSESVSYSVSGYAGVTTG